jgi:hypothetical protein
MAKATHVKVSSVWKEVVNVWRNVGGVWKPEVMPYRKVSGVWKECMTYGSSKLYAADRVADNMDEINPDNGVVIDEIYKYQCIGCGGDGRGRLYNVDEDRMYELNPSTYATISNSGTHSPDYSVKDIGGLGSQVFIVDDDDNDIREENPDHATPFYGYVQKANSPDTSPDGVGGTNDELFYSGGGNVAEINPSNLAVLRGPSASPVAGSTGGIGGIDNRLFHVDASNDKIHELNPATFASINNFDAAYNYPTGVGGTKTS